MQNVYTVAQAAAVLGVSPGRVRQFILAGRLPAGKFGRDLALPARAVDAFAQVPRRPGNPSLIAPAGTAGRKRRNPNGRKRLGRES